MNARFDPTYGVASRQDIKNENIAFPGFEPDRTTTDDGHADDDL